MNIYGDRAMRYWRRYRPRAYAAMGNSTEHFSALGEQIAQMVETLAEQLAGPRLPGEGFLDRLGRLTNAATRAEGIAMDELVYSDPPENLDGSAPDGEEDPVTARLATYSQWSGEMDRRDREFRDRVRREREEQLDREAAAPAATR